MKKPFLLILIVVITFLKPINSFADKSLNAEVLSDLFENHGVVMLLVDPVNGAIVNGNIAAAEYYGYHKNTLRTMNISDINALSPDEISNEISLANEEKRNFFIFRHKLADGSIRWVEVYSYPVHIEGRDLLFSIIHDVTEKTDLQMKHERIEKGIHIAGGLVISFLVIMVSFLILNGRKLKKALNLIDDMNAMRETFINADKRLIYLKDENFNYAFVNHALEEFYGKPSREIIGKNDFDLSDKGSAEQRRRTDFETIQSGSLITDEEQWDQHIYEVTKFPVQMPNGNYGVGAYKKDVTEERILENKQKRILLRHMILVDILTREFTGKKEHMDYVLDKALELTESQYGYIYFYDEITQEFQLNSWSSGVMKDCEIIEKQTKYELHRTGFWGEVVRQRKPIIENRFDQENALKKGCPEGHVSMKRFISVPVIVDEKIVAVIGLANKKTDYDENDIYEMTILMNGVWNELIRKETQELLSNERTRYLQTLVSIGDGVLIVDCSGNVEMLNSVAEQLTGWLNTEAEGKSYKEIFKISHEHVGMIINDPIEEVLKFNKICELGNHAVLTSKDGTQHHLEDSAAPIKDNNGKTLGVVLVFRDVTEKKRQHDKIEYLSFHDVLTGLYNRRFFEEELQRIDVKRNLPISIIMGDANGLKITNDIFGHAYGDLLLKKIAEVMKKVCRTDDIIARWGGDEFVMLLPKTEEIKARQIAERIQKELSKEEIRAIKASASFGYNTKKNMSESLVEILDRAEGDMYRNKTLGREAFKRETVESIINKLHESEPKEKEHSQNVSELSVRIGKELGFFDDDLWNLKIGGYLHDIGKMIFYESGLAKLSKIDYDEQEKHVLVGYRILNSCDLPIIAEIILSHHEQWDGKGYPRGLKGEGIPLLARIVSAADFYYKLKDTVANFADDEDVINGMKNVAGSRLDPCITEIIITLLSTRSL